MIDIHSHIVFGVDDGAQTLEESMSLIEEAYRQGVRTIVATSHRRKGLFETSEETIWAHFQQVKERAQVLFPTVTLIYGGELYLTQDMLEKLEDQQVPTMGGTRYVLIEFSMTTPWKTIQKSVNAVTLLGLTPIIAHLERYDALAFDRGRVEELIAKGALIQVNSNHVLKSRWIGDAAKRFKKRAKFLLNHGLVHCVASDMHNLEARPPYMQAAYQLIKKDYGEAVARELFSDNAKAWLKNQ